MPDAILFLIGVVWFIGWIISSVQEGARKRQRNAERTQELKSKWGNRALDKTKSLKERNEDIVQNHLKKLSAGYHRPYYIDNSVRDCIQEIADAEGYPSAGPGYQYLSSWILKAGPTWKTLAESLRKRFSSRHRQLEDDHKKEQDT